MDAHRVDVLHGTHDGAVVTGIAHDLILEFLPSENALFNQHLTNLRMKNALTGNFDQFTGVPCCATAQSTQCEGGANQNRVIAKFIRGSENLLD